MVYTDDIVVWEPNGSTLEKKLQRVVTVCEDFGLNVCLSKCVVMEISWNMGCMEKINCNSHELKEVESFKYLGSEIMAYGIFNEEITKRIQNAGKYKSYFMPT
jgi:hypothetical protein